MAEIFKKSDGNTVKSQWEQTSPLGARSQLRLNLDGCLKIQKISQNAFSHWVGIFLHWASRGKLKTFGKEIVLSIEMPDLKVHELNPKQINSLKQAVSCQTSAAAAHNIIILLENFKKEVITAQPLPAEEVKPLEINQPAAFPEKASLDVESLIKQRERFSSLENRSTPELSLLSDQPPLTEDLDTEALEFEEEINSHFDDFSDQMELLAKNYLTNTRSSNSLFLALERNRLEFWDHLAENYRAENPQKSQLQIQEALDLNDLLIEVLENDFKETSPSSFGYTLMDKMERLLTVLEPEIASQLADISFSALKKWAEGYKVNPDDTELIERAKRATGQLKPTEICAELKSCLACLEIYFDATKTVLENFNAEFEPKLEKISSREPLTHQTLQTFHRSLERDSYQDMPLSQMAPNIKLDLDKLELYETPFTLLFMESKALEALIKLAIDTKNPSLNPLISSKTDELTRFLEDFEVRTSYDVEALRAKIQDFHKALAKTLLETPGVDTLDLKKKIDKIHWECEVEMLYALINQTKSAHPLDNFDTIDLSLKTMRALIKESLDSASLTTEAEKIRQALNAYQNLSTPEKPPLTMQKRAQAAFNSFKSLWKS